MSAALIYRIVLLLALCCTITASLTIIRTSEVKLDCSKLDAAKCKLEFRAEYEKLLRIHVLELIKKLTTQSGRYIKEYLKRVPAKNVEKREKLQQLVDLYDQAMNEAVEYQNDTRKLFLTISGGTRFRNYSLTQLLGEENAIRLDERNLKELDRFCDRMGHYWMILNDRLGDEDKNQFSDYQEITKEVSKMIDTEGLVKLDLFKRSLRKIFKFLNMSDD